VEAKRAETIGDEVQASQAEGLEGAKMGGAHSPVRGAMGNTNEPKRIVSPRPARLEVSETKAIRSPGRWMHDVLPTDSVKLSALEMAGS
jgi:hypothetical protein